MTATRRLRSIATATSLLIAVAGCDSVLDFSDFQQFEYTLTPVFQPVLPGQITEARITRMSDGTLQFDAIIYDIAATDADACEGAQRRGDTDTGFLCPRIVGPRTLTDGEAQQVLALFAAINVKFRPANFACATPAYIEAFRWDDRTLSAELFDCSPIPVPVTQLTDSGVYSDLVVELLLASD